MPCTVTEGEIRYYNEKLYSLDMTDDRMYTVKLPITEGPSKHERF